MINVGAEVAAMIIEGAEVRAVTNAVAAEEVAAEDSGETKAEAAAEAVVVAKTIDDHPGRKWSRRKE